MQKIFRLPEQGLEVEIGKYARQADGSVWIKSGNNIVLSTAVSAKAREFLGFFPLTVEYRERPSAAGRIPGGYIKREGKLSDSEVLISRLIDRPIRPLFPSTYTSEVQLISSVYSSDGKFPSSVLAIIGSSLALAISRIPFLGPVGAIQIGRVGDKWIFNPSFEETEKSKTDIMIAGTKAGICMVEGNCDNASEEELVDLFFKAHEEIKKQIAWQEQIQQEIGAPKDDSYKNELDWDVWKKRIQDVLPANFDEQFFAATKMERSDGLESLKKDIIKNFDKDIEEKKISESVLNFLLDGMVKEVLPDVLVRKQARVDGRNFDQVRQIASETSILPCVHGSAMFQRGETQVLASLTLGTGQDAQKIESLIGGALERTFMLHYNFPPFATGEVKPLRGAGRREIGHGYLAERSFISILPSQEEFPYVIRSVVDVLESNGSSSMATVCATALAMMDAGVPVKDMVSGVAMGLIRDSSGNFHVLTDILGMEDAFGLMDFKVVGTEKGIVAFQLDIKDKIGFTRELFIKALQQAKQARLHILNEMKKTMTAPRPQVSALAPRVFSMKVATDKIGAIIGPSGKNIREIIAKTNTQIDIEDDGTVKIYAKNNESAAEAESWVRTLSGDIKPGTVYAGIIRRIADFGLIVELVAGKEGMVHISTIAREKQVDFEEHYKVGDKLTVKVVAVDRETGRIRLTAPELERA